MFYIYRDGFKTDVEFITREGKIFLLKEIVLKKQNKKRFLSSVIIYEQTKSYSKKL